MKYLKMALEMAFLAFKIFFFYCLAFFCLSDGSVYVFSFFRELFELPYQLNRLEIIIDILSAYLLFPAIVAVLIIGLIGPFAVGANRFVGFFIAGLISITQIVCGSIGIWNSESRNVFILLTIILGAIVAFFLGGYTYFKIFNLRENKRKDKGPHTAPLS
ncbi:MAG: hypothetical protein KAJ18_08030 [Candidatus Omnitrophica bacterium]|nr:hypothetical protein [Candidatus Omnitrophota bacterium]